MPKPLKIFLFILSLGIIIFFLGPRGLGLSCQIKAQSEQDTEDIDLSNLVADIDLEARKSILYMPDWPEAIEEEKVLFIPSTGVGTVYLCPRATSLNEVNPECEDRIILNVGESKGDLFVDITNYEGREYYIVYGVTGTGGGEMEEKAVRLETQIAITKMEYGGEGILEKVTKDVGDKKPPLLLSELKESSIDLEEYLLENKRMIYPTQKKKLKMRFKFLETAGNEYQEKSINVRFKFKATQEEQ